MANFIDSEEHFPSYSNEGDSDELSLIPATHVEYAITELQLMMPNDESNQYMVLYNGNAEVIGNFRALNFYKASDINIKEDVRLLIDDRDPRSVLLKIDGVEYKFKQGATNAPMNKRFVGYIAQQIESVVPEAVQLIDGILHVDYESLIPYLSESIKQNFRDINDIKSDTSQLHQVIDTMYKEFVRMDKTKADKQSTANRTSGLKSSRSLVRWIISASLTTLLLLSVVIGVFFIVPLMHEASNTSQDIQSPNTPSTVTPNETPSLPYKTPTPKFPSHDQEVLVEFYHATGGDNWFDKVKKASPSISVCEWPGVVCDKNFRVIAIRITQGALVGTIPDSIGKLDKLTVLRLHANRLFGTIPASIGNITGLVELDLGLSQFTGSLPLEIFSLTSLNMLAIANNVNMSWTIPPQIANLKQLKIFNAPDSGLYGTIPNEISQLTALTWLVLGSNNLTGTVPSLANTSVNQLNLANNKLTGPIPKLNSAATKLR